jgi:hypothetical protein
MMRKSVTVVIGFWGRATRARPTGGDAGHQRFFSLEAPIGQS